MPVSWIQSFWGRPVQVSRKIIKSEGKHLGEILPLPWYWKMAQSSSQAGPVAYFICLAVISRQGFVARQQTLMSLVTTPCSSSGTKLCFPLWVKSDIGGSRAVLPRDINSKGWQDSLSPIFRSGCVYICLCIHTLFSETGRGKNGLKE